jgi:hypothetical protein
MGLSLLIDIDHDKTMYAQSLLACYRLTGSGGIGKCRANRDYMPENPVELKLLKV